MPNLGPQDPIDATIIAELMNDWKDTIGVEAFLVLSGRAKLSLKEIEAIAGGQVSRIPMLTAARLLAGMHEPLRRDMGMAYRQWARDEGIRAPSLKDLTTIAGAAGLKEEANA